MIPADVIGAPHFFLSNRYPAWKEDHQTHMIPPVFTTKCYEQMKFSSDIGDNHEGIIFNSLQQLGELSNIGMFVIYGLKLDASPNMNNLVCHSNDYGVNSGASKTDFLIFHHTFGVISLQVKIDPKIPDKAVLEAENKFDSILEFIKSFANFNEDNFYHKILALPTIIKSDFFHDDFPSLNNNTLVLFQDDIKSIESFQKWWNEVIEYKGAVYMSPQIFTAYERALSYILMLRHLGPVTEAEGINSLHESLTSNKFHGKEAYPQVLKHTFPHFLKWAWNVLRMKSDHNFEIGVPKELKKAFINRHSHPSTEDLKNLILLLDTVLKSNTYQNVPPEITNGISVLRMKQHRVSGHDLKCLIKPLDELLKDKNYITGDVMTVIDDILAVLFKNTMSLFFDSILEFINAMRMCQWNADAHSIDMKNPPYIMANPKSFEDLNQLGQYLSSKSFIEGDQPSDIDEHIFKQLTCHMRLKHSRLPPAFTTEQLKVFEGPCKQLIIGPPGSGKTELMKFKALELELEMKICQTEKKILYLVANGSPGYKESLLFHHLKDFFKASTMVEVMTIVLDDGSLDLEKCIADLRGRIDSKEYGHVFIDEYWIRSRPAEHKIILDLINEIPGYVWISSVFDYDQNLINTKEKMKTCTKPLLTALENNGGTVNRITKVMRSTNNIVNLEKWYSGFYQIKTYPYGTEQIHGHYLEGLPITWAVEENISGMYTRCVDIIDSAIRSTISPSGEKLALDPADIVIMNFAIRAKESVGLKLENYLHAKKISFWKFGDSIEELMDCKSRKVALLQSLTRADSSYLDGVEWPMVIVILPSGVLLKTAELADEAYELRNYDPYIALFRSMVKLVIISDKWQNGESFLKDVEIKSRM